MRTNVRGYSDQELLERVRQVGGEIRDGRFLVIGVQSTEDAFNLFDDKFYVFDGGRFVMVSSGTTNPGRTALHAFDRYRLPGAAVWKTDKFYKNLYTPGLHKGRMKALRQSEPIFFYRDADKDRKSEQKGELYFDIIYANMHCCSYNDKSRLVKTDINGWSFGCQVWNDSQAYYKMIDLTWARKKPVDYCLLKEF